MTDKRKRIIFIFTLFNSLILLFTIGFCLIFEPKSVLENSPSYTCLFQKRFGIYCPGCGGTRSLAYLLSFDFINSFIYYPPNIIGLLLIIYFNILLIISLKKDSLSLLGKHRYFEFLIIPVSILLNFVIRNALLYFGIDFIGDILV